MKSEPLMIERFALFFTQRQSPLEFEHFIFEAQRHFFAFVHFVLAQMTYFITQTLHLKNELRNGGSESLAVLHGRSDDHRRGRARRIGDVRNAQSRLFDATNGGGKYARTAITRMRNGRCGDGDLLG